MFEDVQRHVAGLIRGKILVGYGLWNFLSVSVFAVIQTVATYTEGCKVLGLSHPAIDTRDTALFMPFRKSLKVKPSHMVPLATLVQRLMGHHIGLQGEVPVSLFITSHRSCITPCSLARRGSSSIRLVSLLRDALGRHRQVRFLAMLSPSVGVRKLFHLVTHHSELSVGRRAFVHGHETCHRSKYPSICIICNQ